MSKLVEEWRPVVGYEGLYEVSDWGRVRSLDMIVHFINRYGFMSHYNKKGRMLKLINSHGYKKVGLGKDNQKDVHRLVAEAFIPNLDNKPQVDHIIPVRNGGTNDVWNLRWATQKENLNNEKTIEHFRKIRHDKTIVQLSLDGEYINEFSSSRDAEQKTGVNQSDILKCCKGKYFDGRDGKWYNVKQRGGFIWRYKEGL